MSSPFTQLASLGSQLNLQIAESSFYFPPISGVLGVLLIGSCSTGEATLESQIELLVILKEESITDEVVNKIRNEIKEGFHAIHREDLLQTPLPVQFTWISVRQFEDQGNGNQALDRAKAFWDPDQVLGKRFSEI